MAKPTKEHSDAYFSGYREGRRGEAKKGRVSNDEYAGFKRGYADAGWGPGNQPASSKTTKKSAKKGAKKPIKRSERRSPKRSQKR